MHFFKSIANVQPDKLHRGQWLFVHLGYQTFQTISQGKMYEYESKVLSLSDQKTSSHIQQE